MSALVVAEAWYGKESWNKMGEDSKRDAICRAEKAITALKTCELATNNVLIAGSITIDLERHIVKQNGIEVPVVKGNEYKVLLYLASRYGKVCPHHEIMSGAWGPGYSEQVQYLRVALAELRKKIPGVIKTIRNVGYIMEKEEINDTRLPTEPAQELQGACAELQPTARRPYFTDME